MDAEQLMVEINNIFWNKELTDDDVANELLDVMDANRETVEFDRVLKAAYRVLNIWSRTETDTGLYLDQFADILKLEGPMLEKNHNKKNM
ncbi:hypothetical protein [Caldifermentibacillus hisashii]|uniref:hypothetical protein n=1 Tax=Caldifermentibacillus hisashii TaxID=996558 RepID=UPI001C1064FF|nr:hypothetical protein [Caldifermentibacillus hisashii]MBU5342296.1 hypothetical protein [Caldifermentibacillus hisashii]